VHTLKGSQEKTTQTTFVPRPVVAIVLVVVSSVVIAVFALNLADGVDLSPSTFILKFESQTSDKWTFSAQSAQGHSSIFCDLSQEELNKLSVDSRIAEGEISLVLSQGEKSQSIDLSGGTRKLSAEDLGVDMFNPGRIKMQLKFNNAKNLDVKIGWR
jgi:hypothetical protein